MTSPESIPDEDLSAEEARQQRRRRLVRRAAAIGIPAVAITAIALALAIPRIKDWRARQFTAQAEELLAAGKLQEAFNNASSAMQLRPASAEVRRTYAKVLRQSGNAEGVDILRAMVDEGAGEPRDRLDLADAALAFGDAALAEREALALLREDEKNPEALLRLARVHVARQRGAEAEETLRTAIGAGAGPEAAILLARLLYAANRPEAAAEATNLLRPLAARSDQSGLEALLALLASPAAPTAEGPGWIAALRAHPEATDEQKLAAAGAEIRIDPRRQAEVVRRTVSEYGGGTPDQRAQLGRWLNQQREYDEVLELIGAEEASTRSDLFLIRLDALAARGEWETIGRLLRKDGVPLQVPVVLLYRGRAARESGDAEAAVALYRRAVIEAARTPDVMWYVINYLQRVGEDETLERELERLTDNPATARQAFQALVPLVQKRQDAGELFGLYDRMLGRLPAEAAVQNDHRYFAALTGRPPDVDGARDLADREPGMLAYRITLSLLLLKSSRPAEALAVFDGVTLDPGQIQPYQRAVLAAVLGANGREDEARQLAASVPQGSVTAEELELIAPWRDTGD